MFQSLGILSVFTAFYSKLILLKMYSIFKKHDYRFLVESTTTKSATFLYKTALSETNVKYDK